MKWIALFSIIVLSTAVHAQTVTTSPVRLTWKDVLPFDTAQQRFAITNTSTASVTCVVSGVKAPFSLAGDSTVTLGPLATDSITVLFWPTDVRGDSYLDTLIAISDGGPPFSKVVLAGASKQFYEGTIKPMDTVMRFGTVIVGQEDTLSVVATNVGKSDLTVSAIMENSVSNQASLRLITKANLKTVSAGSSFVISVRFAPFDAGSFADTLLITTNDTTHPKIRVAISGRAISETGTINVTPPTLDFGKVLLGSADTLRLTAANAGQTNVIFAASLAPGHDFSLLGNYLSDTITVSEHSSPILIVFKPIKSPGVFFDTVVLLTNDTLRSTIRVPVIGEGVQPVDDVTPTSGSNQIVDVRVVGQDLMITSPASEIAEIRIVDLLGRECFQTRVASGMGRLNLTSLENGSYFCLVRSGSLQQVTRFVLER